MKLKDAIAFACEKYKYPWHVVDGVPRIKRGGAKCRKLQNCEI